MKKQFAAASLSILLGAACAHAGLKSASFNFESAQPTSLGGHTSLIQTDNGLSLDIDRDGQAFDVTDLASRDGASGFGLRSLAPTPPGMNFFNVNFSQPITSFSAQLGDFGVGFSDTLALRAFSGPNGTGRNLGSSAVLLPLNSDKTFASKTIGIKAPAIGSVQLIGGTPAAGNSVFYDNFRATFNAGATSPAGSHGSVVPLPLAVYVMPICLGLSWLAARRLTRRDD